MTAFRMYVYRTNCIIDAKNITIAMRDYAIIIYMHVYQVYFIFMINVTTDKSH